MPEGKAIIAPMPGRGNAEGRPNRLGLEVIAAVVLGLIDEIGVSVDFTAEEEKSLVSAARAQRRTGLPLMVHLPGWFRHGQRVLDADLRHTVLCHMNPSHNDVDYQMSLAGRGAFIE
jgi:phosphotriesterase-related protein